MTEKTSPYYPVFLNVKGRKCVVIGGGQVALRKVNTLLECGAGIEVVSPELCPELYGLAENRKIVCHRKRFESDDLKGAFIVIAATDESRINREITKEARENAIPVNIVDDPDNSDFIIPSSVRRGDITIAVSTGGRSPALARKIRTILEREFGEEYAALVELIDEVRTELKNLGITIEGEDWQEALDLDSLIDLLKKGDREKARTALLNKLKMRAK